MNLQTDFAGYELLLDYIQRYQLYNLNGDVVEIGAFMGGGTRKLAEFFGNFGKKVIVVDVFDPSFDQTLNERGESMSSIYTAILGNRDLLGIFNRNVEHLENVIVNHIDSRNVVFAEDLKLCFSVIDGNHNPWYVRNDFESVWKRTVEGGAVALHDYGGDLPQVTKTIDHLIEGYAREISRIDKFPEQCFIFITKRGVNNEKE
jgi:hypothetical protein